MVPFFITIRGGRWGSNPQHRDPQSRTLPLSYAHHEQANSITALSPSQGIL